MRDDRTIAEFHATRTSGEGCPGTDGGRHYFAFLDPNSDDRMCIDCGEPERYTPTRDAEPQRDRSEP